MAETNKRKLRLPVILFMVCLIAAAAYYGYKTYIVVATTNRAALDTRAQIENDATVSLNSPLNAQDNQAETQSVNAHNKNSQELKSADALVKLAADRLKNPQDIPLAVQLLDLAQKDLAQLNDPAVLDIQNMLVADQKKLMAINYPDINLINSKLDALGQLIDGLPVKTTNAPMTNLLISRKSDADADADATAAKVPQEKWRQKAVEVYNNIKSSIRVRKKSDLDPALAFVNLEFKRARFNLLLDQMRWGALYGDQTIYQRSLTETQDLLTQVFDENDANVQKFAGTLDELAAIQVHPEIPSIQGTIDAINELIVR